MAPSGPVRTTIAEYSSGVDSRPFTDATYCICCPRCAGSPPMVPAGATTFCSLMMPDTSSVVTPSRAIFAGSSQMRMP